MSTIYELGSCPACGDPRQSLVATREDVQQELADLWEFHLRRLRPEIPPERLLDRVVFSQDPPLQVVRCGDCGLVFRNPRESSRTLLDEYREEEADPATLRRLFEAQRRSYRRQAGRLARLLPRITSGLEVGSYVGAFLAAASERGWSFEGLDINPHATRFARERGFAVRCGTLESLPPEHRYQVVAIWNCFEQLPSPRSALASVRRFLLPHGLVTLRVPSGAFYASLHRRLRGPLGKFARALLAHNNLLGFPYRHGFTAASLRRLLEDSGFEIVEAYGDPLVPTSDDWTHRWARFEERILKGALHKTGAPAYAPWIEVYARLRHPS